MSIQQGRRHSTIGSSLVSRGATGNVLGRPGWLHICAFARRPPFSILSSMRLRPGEGEMLETMRALGQTVKLARWKDCD
jgi:hypothetical protein